MKMLISILSFTLATSCFADTKSPDHFQKALALFNQGTEPKVSSFEMWQGIRMYYTKGSAGPVLHEYQMQEYLTLAQIDLGPLGSDIRGNLYHPNAGYSWDEFYAWAQNEILYRNDYYHLSSQNSSLLLNGASFTAEFRASSGSLISIIHKEAKGLCPDSKTHVPSPEGICGVLYFYKVQH